MKTGKWMGILALAAAVLMAPQMSMAEGADTNFNTTVTNTVSVDYESGTNLYNATDTVDFVVDRKLDWVMAPTDQTLAVYENTTDNLLAFTVENNTNGPVDILISLAQQNEAPAAIGLYLDVNGDGLLDGGDSALSTSGADYYLDEMAEDEVRRVLVVVDVADDAPSTDVYDYIVTTTTYEAGGANTLGAALADDSAALEDAASVQNVYNDGAGYSDAAADFTYTAYVSFTVVASELTVTKTAEVISDGLGAVAPNAKAIPGATVEYTIVVENIGDATATNVDLSDAVPANTTLVGGSLSVTGGGTPTATEGDPITVLDAEIAAGASMTVTFQVTID